MNLLLTEVILKITEGIITGLSFLVVAVIYIYFFNVILKYTRRVRNMMSASRRALVREAEARGLDLSPYNDFNTEQLFEIVQGLLAGLDVSNYARQELTAGDMQRFRTQYSKVDKKRPVETLPSINDVEKMGFSPRYITLDPNGKILYKLHSSYCDVQLGGSDKRYAILKCQEGYYLHRTGLVSMFLEGHDHV